MNRKFSDFLIVPAGATLIWPRSAVQLYLRPAAPRTQWLCGQCEDDKREPDREYENLMEDMYGDHT